MRLKFKIVLCILASMFGYLSWGQNNASFFFHAEWVILQKLLTDPTAVLHPMIILPLAGQGLLIFCLFQRLPNKWILLTGISLLSILFLFLLVVGALALNIYIVISVLPFLLLATVALIHAFGSSRALH